MDKKNTRLSARQAGWLGLALALCAVLLFVGGSGNSGAATPKASASVLLPNVTCPAGQCFTDVPPGNGFFDNINALYMDGIIGGYPCGGSGEPCDADNRPYYRPANLVSRQQMSKFVDLGRRNIADAIGHSLYISTTAGIAGDFETRSGGEAVYAQCLQAGNNCYALEGYAPTGDYAGYMYGGKGVYAESDDSAQPAVDAAAYGSNSYGVHAESATYRGGYVKSDSNVLYSMYVDDVDGPTQGTAALNVRGTIRGEGNLVIGGSKAGYVVDIMQNVGAGTLEPGDVVTIVGNAAPVLGQIPLVTVKKADSAYDSSVAGVVDQVWYVPDAATKAAYDKQEADLRAANDQRNQATTDARAKGTKPDFSKITLPTTNISDAQGVLHAIPDATQVATNGYLSAVTLGSYKAVKVDASFGPIHAGDMLVSSSNAGYAMKATDKSQAFGAVIGKALGDLDSGTGTIPVLVTLK